MSARFSSAKFEDPTIGQTCALEYDRLWNRIAFKVQNGAWFYRGREEVISEEIPHIAATYGRIVADRVSKAINQTNPSALPNSAKNAARVANQQAIEEHLILTRGKIGWFNRLWLRWFGVHFW